MTTRLILLLLLLLPQYILAQSDKEEKEKDRFKHPINLVLQFGAEAGGEINYSQFNYQGGGFVQLQAEKWVSKKVSYGIGTGYTRWQELTHIPVYLSFRGLTKNDDSATFLAGRFGYSFTNLNNSTVFNAYDARGGAFFSPSIGRRFTFNEGQQTLYIGLQYTHQFGQLLYTGFSGEEYKEPRNYDMLGFFVGIALGSND